MNEVFFGRPNASSSSSSFTAVSSGNSITIESECKPLNCLSSKSIRSNQACNNKRVSQKDLIGEILKYAQVEPTSSAAVFLKTAVPDGACFLQCSLCFALLDDHPDELKAHIVRTHVYNESLNKCMVCCYCR